MIKFEWEEEKAQSNIKKHHISFDEAQSVFYDDFALQFFDEEHSVSEARFLILGRSCESNLLMICHCEREEGNVIRIISARKATKNESQYYLGGW